MAKHLFLPTLRDNPDIVVPRVTGAWERNPPKVLRQVSDGIPIDTNAQTRGISSVPDVWARPLTFEAALRRDSSHPLRERLVQEWRGLLSVLALRELHPTWGITLRRVELDGGAFSTALRNLKPRAVRLERELPYDWTDIVLIKYKRITLGAFSPATLVYTAAAYHRALADEADFSLKDTEGFLRPPSDEKRWHVAEWLSHLRAALRGGGGNGGPVLYGDTADLRDRDSVETINNLLQEWHIELTTQLGITDVATVDSPDVELSDKPHVSPFDERYRVYGELLRTMRPAKGSSVMSESDYTMVFNADRGRTSVRKVVVISPRLLRKNGRVWGITKVADLGGDAETAVAKHFKHASGTAIPGHDLRKHDAIWIRPEKYFLTDTLIAGSQGSHFISAAEATANVDTRFVLPFKRELLDYYSADEIVERLKPTYEEVEGGIRFSFLLPVGDGEERVEKLFRYGDTKVDEGSIRAVTPPTIEIFPRYLDCNWRRYYLIHDAVDQLTIQPLVGNTQEGIETRIHGRAIDMYRARITQITRDRAYPEALELSSTSARPTALGLILLKTPTEPRGLSRSWRVGVDFGTSNTNVFMKREDDPAVQWKLRFADYLHTVTSSSAQSRSEVLRAFFVPPEDVRLPVPTHLLVHDDSRMEHPLLDYFVHFSEDPELPRNVYTDIKWDEEGQRKSEYFLESVLMMILIEANQQRVRKLTIAYSYPKAFSPSALEAYQNDWRRLLKKLVRDPETRIVRPRSADNSESYSADQDRIEIVEPVHETEGIVAGEFFANADTMGGAANVADIENAALCLDIGGGTTDYSLWYDREIVLDASVRLAGRQISDALRLNPRLLELLLAGREAALALEGKRDAPSLFAAQLNVVLHRSGSDVMDRLSRFITDRHIQWLRRILVVEFGALAFYAGSLAGAANRYRSGLLSRLSTNGLALHWGGNGAKFLNWMGLGRFGEGSPAANLLNAIIYQTLKDQATSVSSERLAQHQSPGHKQEAAGGLVVMKIDEKRGTKRGTSSRDVYEQELASDQPVGVVVGEDVDLTSGPLQHTDIVSAPRLFHGDRTTFERTSLTRLNRFLEILNVFGTRFGILTQDSRIELDERMRTRIEAQTRGAFVQLQTQAPDRRTIEPVFITEVKLLLNLMANELP